MLRRARGIGHWTVSPLIVVEAPGAARRVKNSSPIILVNLDRAMTTLAAWVSVDSEKLSACYLMSDSRITWPDAHWDAGQKLFVSTRFPDVFGYSGDVQFPTLVLRTAIDRLDQGLLVTNDSDSTTRHKAICHEMGRAYRSYPAHSGSLSTILHFSRTGTGKYARFKLWKLTWSRDLALRSTPLDLPTTSVIGETAGSGWRVLVRRNADWREAQGRTARGVFGSFCDALDSHGDPMSSGPPQLVALYPSFPARMFGIVWNNARFLAGAPVGDSAQLDAFEWRNHLFERVDPQTLQRLSGAKRQPKPTTLA